MKFNIVKVKLTLVFVILAFFIQCGKSSESTEDLDLLASKDYAVSSPQEMEVDQDFDSKKSRSKSEGSLSPNSEKKQSDDSLPIQFSQVNPNWERLLEYEIQLDFETKDFAKSRKNLYDLASKFGFLQDSNDGSGNYNYLQSHLWIRTEKLHEFLDAANGLGNLQSEKIHANDLTYQNFEQKITLDRERIRGARRNKAISGAADAKNFTERERLLSESEDKEDKATKEKWLIEDRVTWAKVSIEISDPALKHSISIPNYKIAIYDLISGFLYITYLAIYWIPVLFILAIFWWKKESIRFYLGKIKLKEKS